MQKAVFIDRDGVLNSDVGHYYIFKPDDFVLNEGVVEALKLLVADGFILVVITNQGGISKGKYTQADVEAVHAKLVDLLLQHDIHLAEIYYCPHHSDNEKCLCRKPGNLNIEKAITRFKIDRDASWMIGDNKKDIEAGERSGLRTVKINSNENILPWCKKIIADS